MLLRVVLRRKSGERRRRHVIPQHRAARVRWRRTGGLLLRPGISSPWRNAGFSIHEVINKKRQ